MQPAFTHFAEVILPLALPLNYTYAIPDEWIPQVVPGIRVEVTLRNKKYAAIIKSVHQQKPAFDTRPILNILDDQPILFPQQLHLWEWMASYYMCTEGEVMAAALPAHFKLSSETILLFNEAYGEEFSALGNEEFLVAEALLIRKELRLLEVQQILDSSHVYPVVKKLIDKQVCFVWEALDEKYKNKKENYILLHPQYHPEAALETLLNDWKGAPKQMELLLSFLYLQKTEGEVTQTALLKKSGATTAQLKGLTDKNILQVDKRIVDRIKTGARDIHIAFTLQPNQTAALEKIQQHFTKQPVCLLHGVTGSGKTLIYIKLIEEQIRKGNQVLYLLPEIALTAQVIRRLQTHFGGHIAIYHSKFNNHERVELWNKVKNGEVQAVLGARSALLLPFQQLGLVIVDEEHDPSYKQQDPAPRYNARDTAIFYASLFPGARVLLGSATPSLETFYNTRLQKYGLVQLNERYGDIALPRILFVDTRQVSQKNKIMISPVLQETIEASLKRNKQVILFQNRRGYNPYLICGTCGYIPQCKHCDVSLTLHKFSNKLHCHYCGSSYPKLITCPQCGTQQWLEKNFGTEKIEEQLQADFPDAKTARMDVDSIRGKKAHDNLIQQFEQQQVQILVGTQMVVKGLDFDNVNLVGILDADGLLSFADFRVSERAFQLMEQVSGRAGRKEEQGTVLIQTTNPAHPVLAMVQQHDYEKFYDWEIANRMRFAYPPFTRLILLTLKHKDQQKVNAAANKLAAMLRRDFKDHVVGPAAPVIARVRNQYRMEILLKLPKESGRSSSFKKVINNHIQLLLSEAAAKSVQITADVDPV